MSADSNTPLSLIRSPCASYDENFIRASTTHHTTTVSQEDNYQENDKKEPPGDKPLLSCVQHTFHFRTLRQVSRTGVMLVGWGGANGSTLTAGVTANKKHLKWNTKHGPRTPNYL